MAVAQSCVERREIRSGRGELLIPFTYRKDKNTLTRLRGPILRCVIDVGSNAVVKSSRTRRP